MRRTDWRGVFPAITTRMREDESLDLDAVAADVGFQLDAGVRGIICCGSLGEASTLDADEKIAMLEAAKGAAGARVPVLLAIAEDSTRAAMDLAKRGQASGADGLMVLPAMRYLADPREALVHYRKVAAAAELPVMIYNNPVAYGVDLKPDHLEALAEDERFVAIKESSDDVRRVTDIANRLGDRFALFAGVDNIALESLWLGAVGWVAGLVCAFPKETVRLFELAKAGDIEAAVKLYRWFMPLLHLDVSTKLVQNIKLVEYLTRGASPYVRLPRMMLDGDERAHVERVVKAALAKRPGV